MRPLHENVSCNELSTFSCGALLLQPGVHDAQSAAQAVCAPPRMPELQRTGAAEAGLVWDGDRANRQLEPSLVSFSHSNLELLTVDYSLEEFVTVEEKEHLVVSIGASFQESGGRTDGLGAGGGCGSACDCPGGAEASSAKGASSSEGRGEGRACAASLYPVCDRVLDEVAVKLAMPGRKRGNRGEGSRARGRAELRRRKGEELGKCATGQSADACVEPALSNYAVVSLARAQVEERQTVSATSADLILARCLIRVWRNRRRNSDARVVATGFPESTIRMDACQVLEQQRRAHPAAACIP